ncbi:S-adenosyl-L-methionine-dependent methyltransferase [Colletotrichum phormii]|uniref:S-adenosyl-L-methionine-dependent methyltransferase n=1 Tax=Colletotrichum phormii TaxID=359342 RepID=A0AAI9ZMS2_9PEZI|nr:S-adenosyl-L-methionine-dependent methyltransferase [Colletotrichum phormii]KAK1633509.1 S-adenosyl-L-methionine-dependent methyltransferase [Colletotrichum phormii]
MAVSPEDTAGSNPPIASSSEPTANVITVDPVVENEDTTDAEIKSIHTSSTASLSESITEYRPNDERQNEGLDIAHYWEKLLLNDRLFLAPIGETPQNVLDVGTGTGIWAIDFADMYPSAEVIGVDISPIQPGWVPPNCKFQIDDIEQPWTWPVSYFDFVHISHLEGSVADWPKHYGQAFAHIKSGGLIEVKEIDVELCSQVLAELNEDHVYKRWGKVMLEAMDRLGKTGTQSRNHGIARGLEAAGFVDVVEQQWAAPIGAWPKDPTLKEVGKCHLQYLDQSLEGFGTFLLKEVMGWGYAEIVVFMSEMRKAIRDLKLQSYIKLHVVMRRSHRSLRVNFAAVREQGGWN